MNSDLTFYDRYGVPIAYTDDGINIYLFSGKPVAYLEQNVIYGFKGRHLGWFDNGWIRDLKGFCVFFNDNAFGGPIKPIKHIKPIKGIKQIKPIKSIREIQKIKPIFHSSWSELSGNLFFSE